jgi:hypothetical protein
MNKEAQQMYLENILEKFNANPDDPSLGDIEKVLLRKIQEVHIKISNLSKQLEGLNKEIKERQDKGEPLVQQLVHLQGKSQGYIDSLLALK